MISNASNPTKVDIKYIQGTNFSALILCGTDCGWELVCVRRLRGRAGEGMHLVTYNHRGGTTCTYSYCTWWHTITRAKIPDAPGWFMLSMSCCTLTPSSVVNPSLKNPTPKKAGNATQKRQLGNLRYFFSSMLFNESNWKYHRFFPPTNHCVLEPHKTDWCRIDGGNVGKIEYFLNGRKYCKYSPCEWLTLNGWKYSRLALTRINLTPGRSNQMDILR